MLSRSASANAHPARVPKPFTDTSRCTSLPLFWSECASAAPHVAPKRLRAQSRCVRFTFVLSARAKALHPSQPNAFPDKDSDVRPHCGFLRNARSSENAARGPRELFDRSSRLPGAGANHNSKGRSSWDEFPGKV